jgi:ParB family chromosome partitioning protein
MVAVEAIARNPCQPRRQFDEQGLAELADSVRAHGLLQPVLVAELSEALDGISYQLIAGERRLLAARKAGLAEVPCIVRPAGRRDMLELALVENIHRSDLNPMEKAGAYRELADQFGLTQEQIAERVGQPRATVANYLRLLDLADEVQALVAAGELTFGHAKVLASVPAAGGVQVGLARRAAREQLSVRDLERLAKAAAEGAGGEAETGRRPPETRTAYVREVERQLSAAVGTKVLIRPGRGRHRGRIVIEYYSLDDFDRLVKLLGAEIES